MKCVFTHTHGQCVSGKCNDVSLGNTGYIIKATPCLLNLGACLQHLTDYVNKHHTLAQLDLQLS